MQSITRFWLPMALGSLTMSAPISAHEVGHDAVSFSDSVRSIAEVTVRSRIRHHETIAPQVLQGEALERVNAHTVADAMRYMAGVTLKDYGGIGGLKTVNLRSMGSEHLGIYYDGIELGNAQNGVIDLGQLSLDNIEEISLYQGQRSAIMQTASDFANAGSIYIKTQRASGLSQAHPQRLKFRLQTGYFGTLRLSGLWERRLSQQLRLSANVEALTANGHYDFRYRRINLDGSVAYDTTAVRQNGDVTVLRAELNLLGQTSGDGHWEVKAYTYQANRGIPGAIVNNVWRRGERLADGNSWVQGLWQRDMGERYTLRASAKYAQYRTHYQNNDTTVMMIDHTYRQQEAYVSAINVVELAPWWSLSLSVDGRWNHLDADIPRFAHPTRYTLLTSLATALDLGRLQLQCSVVESYVDDRDQYTSHHQRRSQLIPALFASYRATGRLMVTAFAKQSYRMPTLNDLYYTDMGNAMLRPEKATQLDVGAEWQPIASQPQSDGRKPSLTLSLHAYHNRVADKIVAYPKGQQFRWTMLNLGQVSIRGIDLSISGRYPIGHELQIHGRLNYTYQQAIDVTDPQSSYYRHQIPYTPWHNGNATLAALWRQFDIAYNLVYTGERYCQQENIRYNHLQPWYTSDMHLAWHGSMHGKRLKAMLEVNNLLDQQYDVIINYPMPGRNYNITLQCEF